MAPRSALLILGLQNEFLDPDSGRCAMLGPDSGKSSFVDNVNTFVTHFRARGGDVIWMRSEYQKPRDFVDPRNDETVLIISDDSDSDSEADYDGEETGIQKDEKPKGKGARPPLRTDAFLSVESEHPPCSPATFASEFHPSVLKSIASATDRVMIKTWFSAFKETPLLTTLRGRFISDLYICGVITNVCILATAADAAKHGFNVYVMPDCLGYRNLTAHQQSIKVMVDDYGVEEVQSGALVSRWEKEMLKKKKKAEKAESMNGAASKGSQLGAISYSNEELAKMVADIRRGEVVGKLDRVKEEEGEEDQAAVVDKTSSTVPDNIPLPIAIDPKPTASSDDSDSALQRALADRKAKKEEKAEKAKAEKDAKRAAAKEDNVGEKDEGGKKDGKEKKPREHRKKGSHGSKDSNSAKTKDSPRSIIAPSNKFSSKAPVLGEGDFLGEGDSKLVNNILPRFLAKVAFEKLTKEVAWRTMYHRGGEVPRMVAVEGEIGEDGSFPIYRHPADESPPLLRFSPTVALIKDYVQKALKHPINHVLIQHYRDGNDYISEHSDKTLDIVRGSFIVNVSIGAQRTMILRTKKDAARETVTEPATPQGSSGLERNVQRIPLPHNSMFVLGLDTNKKWLHGIRQDRRESFLKTPEEMANNGERISLTFRHIGTFLTADEEEIYGQGAISKSEDDPHPVINGDNPETEKLIQAFGSENHQSDFDWDASYGAGFDVLHFVPQLPRLFFVAGNVHSNRVRICLAEKGIEFTPHELQPNEVKTPSFHNLSPRGIAPVLVDVDRERTTICESLAILNYLEMSYPSQDPEKFLLPHPVKERAAFALVLQRMQESEQLASILEYGTPEEKHAELKLWDSYLVKTERYVVAGEDISLADIAAWPVVEKFVKRTGWNLKEKYEALEDWRATMAARPSATGLVEGPKPVEAKKQESEESLEDKMSKLGMKEKEETLEEKLAKLGVNDNKEGEATKD